MNAVDIGNPSEQAYILAGGRSKRFGSNKALLTVKGQPLLQLLQQQMQESGLRVTLVAQSVDDYGSLGIPTICDFVPDSGPMAGLIAALTNCQSQGFQRCFVTCCDILEWNPAWNRWILEQFEHGIHSLAVTLSSQDFVPFPGLYHIDCLPKAESCFQRGDRSMRALFHDLGRHAISCNVQPEQLPKSFNTPTELSNLR